MVQAPLAWNAANPDRAPISVTVFDNYFRGGVPGWLGGLEGRDGLDLRNHDMRLPLPEDMGDFEWVVHAAGVASPTYYRAHPIETMDANIGLRNLLDHAVAQTAAGTPVRGSCSSPRPRSMAIRRPRRFPPPRPIGAMSRAPGPAPATTSRSATARRCASTSPSSTGSRRLWPVRSTTTGRG